MQRKLKRTILFILYIYFFSQLTSCKENSTTEPVSGSRVTNWETDIDYFDLGLSFIYSFQSNLDLTLDINNLFNQKYYNWYGYREIPLNVIVGVNYRL